MVLRRIIKSVSVTEIKDVTDTLFGAYVLCVCYRTGVSYGMRLMMKRSVDRHNTDAVFLAEIIVFFRKCLVGYDGVQFFHWRIGHK